MAQRADEALEELGFGRGRLARDRAGLLPAASGGTVLIDEIGEARPELQAKLLRVLSAGAARAVGSTEESPVDARFLFTTRSLDDEARAGRLRADLLRRIRVLSMEVPPFESAPMTSGGSSTSSSGLAHGQDETSYHHPRRGLSRGKEGADRHPHR